MKQFLAERADGERTAAWPSGDRALALVFGDRLGLVLFLGVLAVIPLCWRVGFFINDTYAAANTVVNLAAGHLEITRVEYSITLGSQPGLYRRGASVFGRNYGQAVLAVPVYWVLEAARGLTELRVVIVAGWSLLVAAFAAQLGRVLDRSAVATWGTVLALGLFVLNVGLARPLEPAPTGLLALQIVSMIVAAGVAVVYYRLVLTLHGRRPAVMAGLFVALATPVAFWASIPKRHVLSALLIGVVVAGFAGSRRQTDHALRARALAYVAVGLLAWVQEAEALPVLLVLVPLDLATAPTNGPRQLATVAVAFVASLVPFLVTNVVVTGSPVRTPQMLPRVGEHLRLAADGSVTLVEPTGTAAGGSPAAAGGSGSGATAGSGPLGPLVAAIGAVLAGLAAPLNRVWNLLVSGVTVVLSEPERAVDVFLRSGRIAGIKHSLNDQEAIELTLLESTPVLAALAAVPVIVGHRVRTRAMPIGTRLARLARSHRVQTDSLALGIAVVFSLSYLPRLPLHAQITVRYLLPIVPLLVYLVVRLPPVRRGLDASFENALGTYVAATGVGLALVVIALSWIDPAVGEAMQFHALLNLAVGAVAAVLVGLAAVRRQPRTAAWAVAVPAAATTILSLLAGIEYFEYAEFALPLVRWFSQVATLV